MLPLTKEFARSSTVTSGHYMSHILLTFLRRVVVQSRAYLWHIDLRDIMTS